MKTIKTLALTAILTILTITFGQAQKNYNSAIGVRL